MRLRNFGSSDYQKTVNDLTGAMGPTDTAYWTKTDGATPWNLGAQPLYYSPAIGKYVTSFDQNSDAATWNPLSFGTRLRSRFGSRSNLRFGPGTGSRSNLRFGSNLRRFGACGGGCGVPVIPGSSFGLRRFSNPLSKCQEDKLGLLDKICDKKCSVDTGLRTSPMHKSFEGPLREFLPRPLSNPQLPSKSQSISPPKPLPKLSKPLPISPRPKFSPIHKSFVGPRKEFSLDPRFSPKRSCEDLLRDCKNRLESKRPRKRSTSKLEKPKKRSTPKPKLEKPKKRSTSKKRSTPKLKKTSKSESKVPEC